MGEFDKLDVIIFGATGFTGKWTVYEATHILKNLRWGVAGRNKTKLEAILKEMGEKANTDLSNTPTFIADLADENSLLKMAQKCQIVVNCCGPYQLYGEPVVRACIEAGTHHVDVSGESLFMENMQLKYHKEAEAKGVYIISACAFDSLPTEMGMAFLEKNFDGVLNSVETFLTTKLKGNYTGARFHIGTWESIVLSLGKVEEMKKLRAQLFPQKLPKFLPKLQQRTPLSYSEVSNAYCLPFPSPDVLVAQRTQRILYETQGKRPIQLFAYLNFKSRWTALTLMTFSALFLLFSKFSFGRNLLLKYPKFFSGGFCSFEGPSDEVMQNTHFKMLLHGKGWPNSERLTESTDQYKSPPNKSLTVEVTGVNPGYGATCVGVLCSALTVLRENIKMPKKGGVLPPGVAFAKTNLIAELEKYEHGFKFNVVQKNKL